MSLQPSYWPQAVSYWLLALTAKEGADPRFYDSLL